MNFEHDTIKLVKIQDQYPLNSTLLTLNDKLGLVASCSECTFTVSFIDDPSQSTTTSTTSTSTGDALIKHMQFNANNTLLYICTDKHLSAYSCLLLMSSKNDPVFITTLDGPVKQILPNPECYPNVIAILYESNQLRYLQDDRFLPNCIIQVDHMSWSPKGKQLICALKSGTIIQLSLDSKVMNTIPPCPEYVAEYTDHSIKHIIWIENKIFFVLLKESAYIIQQDSSKPPKTNYIQVNNPLYNNEIGHLIYNVILVRDVSPKIKYLILLSSTQSTDINAIALSDYDANEMNWAVWEFPEAFSITMPLTDNEQDTFPVAFQIDKTAIKGLGNHQQGEPDYMPCPRLWILSSIGKLEQYWMVNTVALRKEDACQMNTIDRPVAMKMDVATTQSASFGLSNGVSNDPSIFHQKSKLGSNSLSTAPSLFGSNTSTSTPIFGQNTGIKEQSLFGSNDTSKPVLFGSNGNASSAIFGQKPTFTATNTSSINVPSSLFGSNASTSPPIFGQNTGIKQQSLFGTNDTSKPILFGSNAIPLKFGQQPIATVPKLSSTNVPSSLFGSNSFAPPSIFGQSPGPVIQSTIPASAPYIFGSKTTTSSVSLSGYMEKPVSLTANTLSAISSSEGSNSKTVSPTTISGLAKSAQETGPLSFSASTSFGSAAPSPFGQNTSPTQLSPQKTTSVPINQSPNTTQIDTLPKRIPIQVAPASKTNQDLVEPQKIIQPNLQAYTDKIDEIYNSFNDDMIKMKADLKNLFDKTMKFDVCKTNLPDIAFLSKNSTLSLRLQKLRANTRAESIGRILEEPETKEYVHTFVKEEVVEKRSALYNQLLQVKSDLYEMKAYKTDKKSVTFKQNISDIKRSMDLLNDSMDELSTTLTASKFKNPSVTSKTVKFGLSKEEKLVSESKKEPLMKNKTQTGKFGISAEDKLVSEDEKDYQSHNGTQNKYLHWKQRKVNVIKERIYEMPNIDFDALDKELILSNEICVNHMATQTGIDSDYLLNDETVKKESKENVVIQSESKSIIDSLEQSTESKGNVAIQSKLKSDHKTHVAHDMVCKPVTLQSYPPKRDSLETGPKTLPPARLKSPTVKFTTREALNVPIPQNKADDWKLDPKAELVARVEFMEKDIVSVNSGSKIKEIPHVNPISAAVVAKSTIVEAELKLIGIPEIKDWRLDQVNPISAAVLAKSTIVEAELKPTDIQETKNLAPLKTTANTHTIEKTDFERSNLAKQPLFAIVSDKSIEKLVESTHSPKLPSISLTESQSEFEAQSSLVTAINSDIHDRGMSEESHELTNKLEDDNSSEMPSFGGYGISSTTIAITNTPIINNVSNTVPKSLGFGSFAATTNPFGSNSNAAASSFGSFAATTNPFGSNSNAASSFGSTLPVSTSNQPVHVASFSSPFDTSSSTSRSEVISNQQTSSFGTNYATKPQQQGIGATSFGLNNAIQPQMNVHFGQSGFGNQSNALKPSFGSSSFGSASQTPIKPTFGFGSTTISQSSFAPTISCSGNTPGISFGNASTAPSFGTAPGSGFANVRGTSGFESHKATLSVGFGSFASQPSVFGSNNQPQGGGFESQPQNGGFGSVQPSAFGNQSTIAFGSNMAPSTQGFSSFGGGGVSSTSAQNKPPSFSGYR